MGEADGRRIAGVLFDFDGTLALSRIDFSSMRRGVMEVIGGFGLEEDHYRGLYILEAIEEASAQLGRENAAAAARLYRTAHELIRDMELEASRGCQLVPGAREALLALGERGVRIGVITRNCRRAVEQAFPDIGHHVHLLLSRDEVRRVKPHPDHLLAALSLLEIPREQAVGVGDHLSDIRAAKELGLKAVGVLTGSSGRGELLAAGADLILESVAQLPMHLWGGGF